MQALVTAKSLHGLFFDIVVVWSLDTHLSGLFLGSVFEGPLGLLSFGCGCFSFCSFGFGRISFSCLLLLLCLAFFLFLLSFSLRLSFKSFLFLHGFFDLLALAGELILSEFGDFAYFLQDSVKY
jgi:hypothetical protein